MKASVQHKYGSADVLELQEVDKPEPRDGEVLLRVHASSVNQADWIALTGRWSRARGDRRQEHALAHANCRGLSM